VSRLSRKPLTQTYSPQIIPFPADGRGCITSTPKSAEFSKKQRFWRKYERDSCMPGAKNGERPYLAAPNPLFGTPFLGHFLRFLSLLSPMSHTYFIIPPHSYLFICHIKTKHHLHQVSFQYSLTLISPITTNPQYKKCT